MNGLLTLFLCALLPLYVSNATLKEENARLKKTIDSLQHVIDSIKADKLIAKTVMLEAIGGNEVAREVARDFSPEVTDSLMHVWYNGQKNVATEDELCNLDSVKFTSNVSDDEMMLRLTAINAYITLPFNQTVKNYMVLYSEKMPSSMSRMLGLSEYYMPIIEEALVRYGLPVELKYMAIIESQLNPVAVSRAGAKGIWQFMYGTGKAYGLRIDSFVDERLDVVKAVDAACRYLRDSYRVFGDWNLAISSYNCGAGNVQKAIRRSGSSNFWDIYEFLPRETRGYVPAFVGAMYAFTYYREYGIRPSDVGMPAVTDTFHIRKNLHFKQINDVVGVPIETLHNLNPQYVHEIIPGDDGPCVLRLPYNWSAPFITANQDSLYLHRSNELINAQVIKNIKESGNETRIAYKVKSGDYLGRIASKYNVSVSQLMKWNHLKSSSLRVGQILYIYKGGYTPTSTTPAASTKSSGTTAAKTSSGYTTYTVQSGDTFYAIAHKYPGVSAQEIMDFNGVKSSALKPGMKIKIPKK